MIFTPASTRRSATACAAAAGTARTPTTISCAETTASSSPKSRICRLPTWLPTTSGDRLAEVAGAEEGDVVLTGGAQDLADLRHQRVDVVADPPLAELAEAREVAADLGRIDVRVVRQFLRGDRLPPHLAGLGQHLQVAGEARGDTEREPLAIAN
jgi:hypothetical protein